MKKNGMHCGWASVDFVWGFGLFCFSFGETSQYTCIPAHRYVSEKERESVHTRVLDKKQKNKKHKNNKTKQGLARPKTWGHLGETKYPFRPNK